MAISQASLCQHHWQARLLGSFQPLTAEGSSAWRGPAVPRCWNEGWGSFQAASLATPRSLHLTAHPFQGRSNLREVIRGTAKQTKASCLMEIVAKVAALPGSY